MAFPITSPQPNNSILSIERYRNEPYSTTFPRIPVQTPVNLQRDASAITSLSRDPKDPILSQKIRDLANAFPQFLNTPPQYASRKEPPATVQRLPPSRKKARNANAKLVQEIQEQAKLEQFDLAERYLGKPRSNYLKLLRCTNPIPICCNPKGHIVPQEIRDLATKVSQFPPQPGTRDEIFQALVNSINNQTISAWGKESPATVQCLNPSWVSNPSLIGDHIRKIDLASFDNNFERAQEIYNNALKCGHVGSGTFSTYLHALIAKQHQNNTPESLDLIRKEAEIVFITAVRLGLGSSVIYEAFQEIMSGPQQSRDLPHQILSPDQVQTLQEFAAYVNQLVQIPISPAATSQSTETLLTQVEKFLGKSYSDHLRLLARANDIPICCDPRDHPPSQEIRDLAIKVSDSELPSDPADPHYQVFQALKNYLNNQIISVWGKKFQATLQCLNPSWKDEIKDRGSVGMYIKKIHWNGFGNKIETAKELYKNALKYGHVDIKMFNCYLDTLIEEQRTTTTPESLSRIQNEAVIVFTTALRLDLVDSVTIKAFKDLMHRA